MIYSHNFDFFIPDYALNFPSRDANDGFVNIWGMPSLTQFTVCLWMKSSDTTNDGTLFSYAAPSNDNEIVLLGYTEFFFFINNAIR